MSKLTKLSMYSELPLFFFLSYLLSWWPALLTNGQILPHGPALAAFLTLIVAGGRPGLAIWRRRLKQRPSAWYWFILGPAIVLGCQSLAFLINLLLGGGLSAWPASPPGGTLIELLLLGGLWEELGWTGYALPKLQERFTGYPKGHLMAALTLGIFRAIWHLPLYLHRHIYWFDILLFETAFQLIIAWLYNRSGGSVVVVLVFHLASNLLGAVFSSAFAGEARTVYYALFMGMEAGISVLLVTLKGLGGRKGNSCSPNWNRTLLLTRNNSVTQRKGS